MNWFMNSDGRLVNGTMLKKVHIDTVANFLVRVYQSRDEVVVRMVSIKIDAEYWIEQYGLTLNGG